VILGRIAAVLSAGVALSLGRDSLGADAAAAMNLEDAIRLAVSGNERARISDLDVVIAQAGVEKARAAFLPALTAQGSDVQHSYAATEKVPNNVGQATITFTQSLINAPAFPLYAQARNLEDAQQAQNIDDKRLLAFAAASAFFAVLNAEDVVQAAQRQLDNAKANLDNTKARAEAQLNSTNDVTRAQVDMANAVRETEADRGLLDSAFVNLALTINAPVPTGIARPEATLTEAQSSAAPVQGLVRFAMSHRPDVLASRYQAAAAHDFAGEPLLRLVPTLGLQGQALATTFSSATGRWHDETLQGVLTWNLYDQGVRYADKHSRDAQAAIADLNLAFLMRSVDAQVRTSVFTLTATQTAFRSAQDAVKSADQSVEETAILYKQGLAKAIELVDANDTRFSSEISLATAEYAMAQAYLGLRQALGLDPLGPVPK
jgi:outer membrane protein TolC